MTEQWDLAQLADQVQERNRISAEQVGQHWLPMVDRVLDRGDRFLIYENVDLGDVHVGMVFGCSYGSSTAQLPEADFPEPPDQPPDFEGQPPSWRYRLKAEVRRA